MNYYIYNKLSSMMSRILNIDETNIGYGIQFNIPITSIPPLRIEYCVNNKTNNFFQIRVYSKSIKI